MKNLCFALLFAAMFTPFWAFAQQFKPAQVNPFGIQKSDSDLLQGFAMGDMNQDNLPDLIYTTDSGTKTNLVINQGTPGSPNFSASPVLDFLNGNNGYGVGITLKFHERLVDFDGDQDLDHLFNYFANNPSAPSNYAVRLNQPELVPANNYDFFFQNETDLTPYGIAKVPQFNYEYSDYKDLTGDGLADIMATRINEITGAQKFVFYQRMTATSFAAGVNNPFGLVSTNGLFGQPCLLDVDQDGDQDMFILAGGTGNWIFYKNKGTAQAPQFAVSVTNPFGLTALPIIGSMAFPLDLNQDGKVDLVAANYQKFFYFELGSTVSGTETQIVSDVQIYPTLVEDKCQVSVNGNLSVDKILISDLRGGNISIVNATQEIDFQTFTPGMYVVTVIMEDGSRFSQKVVKVRS